MEAHSYDITMWVLNLLVVVIGVLLTWQIKSLKDGLKDNTIELKESNQVQTTLTIHITRLDERMNSFEKQQLGVVADIQRNQRENYEWIMKIRKRQHKLGNLVSACYTALENNDLLPKASSIASGVNEDDDD
jgi:septal ring factor EnvC (AmiA/AmiB activator)